MIKIIFFCLSVKLEYVSKKYYNIDVVKKYGKIV